MKWLDLFSGAGMYAVGLEQAGHEVIGFCEKDLWCRKLLKKHWPTKPISSSIALLNSRLQGVVGPESLRAGRARMRRLPHAPERSALEVSEQDYGVRFIEPFAWYDQRSRCWRTWQRCLIEGWGEFLATWPPSGMTRNGIAYELPPLACPMSVNDFMRLPTPLASDYKGTSRPRYRGSPDFRAGRLAELSRTSPSDATYTHPNFAEAVMGLEKDFTLLETVTRRK